MFSLDSVINFKYIQSIIILYFFVWFQVNLTCENDNVDLSVKNILDDVQNIRNKLNTVKTTVDYSDKVGGLSNNRIKIY